MSKKDFLIPQLPMIKKLLSKLNVPYKKGDLKKIEMFLGLLGQMDTIQKHLDRHFAQFNLSPARFSLMILLSYESGQQWTPLSLAQQLSVTKPTITGLLNNLESENLIERVPNPADKRSHVCRLSMKGKQCLQKILPAHFSMMGSVAGAYSSSDLTQFSSKVDEFCKVIEKAIGK